MHLAQPTTVGNKSIQRIQNTGFSLFELLVVIAILAILAGLLLPALAKSKTKAQGVMCMNNHKQMVLSWMMYSDDNKSRLLFAKADPQGTKAKFAWIQGKLDFNGDNRSNWDPSVDIEHSPLWNYGRSAKIWRCPSDPSSVSYQGQKRPRVRSISMNVWVGGMAESEPALPNPEYQANTELSQIATPSKTWLLIDEQAESIDDGCFVTDMAGYPDKADKWILVDYPAKYHNGAAGFAFADGHAEIHRWMDPRTTAQLWPGTSVTKNAPSPGNKDLFWLMDCAGAKKR